jgi:epoxyqueuosine reductase
LSPARTVRGEDKEKLRLFIQEAGFHKVGFSDCKILQEERAFLAERGPGPFEPTDLPPRTDPSLLLPNARTVIAVALSYHHDEGTQPQGPVGRLSKYCQGLDYHDLMLDRLEKVARHLRCEFSAESVSYVDTGPPLERAFAQKAGLGRLGKNTNLIVPRLGSYVFLGVLVTQLEVVPDPPAEYSICGSCTLCLDACPTGCLTDWKLDSPNCLGYLNQKDGDIPVHQRELMGNWLFGCDICQDVCPHNVKAPRGLEPDFEPLPKPGAFPSLVEMVEMSEAEFQQWFGPTAADWRGRWTLQRNALVALGNSSSEEAVDQLLKVCQDLEPSLNEHARWAARELASRFEHRELELRAVE